MMTTVVPDYLGWRAGFNGFGRVLRDEDKKIIAIRELKDCDESEKHIKEINPGYYCFNSEWLWHNIEKLTNDNNQEEYYLTDLVQLACEQGIEINSIKIDPQECLGINTPEQLSLVEALIMQR
jgi:bifunctional UDP-N-acetylglucosamine pyrophosphorylase/glucosamine-1-phosphate N-acetyltransferase